MADRIATVFGGTGFLGSRVVRHLLGQNLSVRIASRHPERFPSSSEGPALQLLRADINDEDAVAAAVAGAYGVVNAVSLYLERGTETFHAVHVEAAERLARQAQQAGVERFVHVSGIGADITSGSPYISRRGEGELAVQAAFANAIIIRPAVMFGPDDAFLNTLVKLLKWLPAYPMFGRGLTRLQPVDVEDVAEAIARGLQPTARNHARLLQGLDDGDRRGCCRRCHVGADREGTGSEACGFGAGRSAENALGRARSAGHLDGGDRYAAATPCQICEPGVFYPRAAGRIG